MLAQGLQHGLDGEGLPLLHHVHQFREVGGGGQSENFRHKLAGHAFSAHVKNGLIPVVHFLDAEIDGHACLVAHQGAQGHAFRHVVEQGVKPPRAYFQRCLIALALGDVAEDALHAEDLAVLVAAEIGGGGHLDHPAVAVHKLHLIVAHGAVPLQLVEEFRTLRGVAPEHCAGFSQHFRLGIAPGKRHAAGADHGEVPGGVGAVEHVGNVLNDRTVALFALAQGGLGLAAAQHFALHDEMAQPQEQAGGREQQHQRAQRQQVEAEALQAAQNFGFRRGHANGPVGVAQIDGQEHGALAHPLWRRVADAVEGEDAGAGFAREHAFHRGAQLGKVPRHFLIVLSHQAGNRAVQQHSLMAVYKGVAGFGNAHALDVAAGNGVEVEQKPQRAAEAFALEHRHMHDDGAVPLGGRDDIADHGGVGGEDAPHMILAVYVASGHGVVRRGERDDSFRGHAAYAHHLA